MEYRRLNTISESNKGRKVAYIDHRELFFSFLIRRVKSVMKKTIAYRIANVKELNWHCSQSV